MWEGGPLRQFAQVRPSTRWGIPYGDGYAGIYVCDHCARPKPNGVYSVRQNEGPSPAYLWLCAQWVFKRGWHGVKRVFVARSDDGEDVFNTSGMLAIAFTEALGMAWTPERERSTGTVFIRILGAMQGDATSYVLGEFTPDLLRFFKRHAPKPLQRIEQRMPSQLTGYTSKP
jgi:hypothetical protein